MTSDHELLEHLYDAVRSEYGLWLQCEEPEKLRTRLYKIRAAEADDTLNRLSFVTSPLNPRHLWLVKRPSDD